MSNTPPAVGPQFVMPGTLDHGSDFSAAYGARAWLVGGAAGRRPSFRAHFSGSMGFGNGVYEGRITTPSSWTVLEDTDNGWDSASFANGYVIQTSGHWYIEAHAGWQNTGGQQRISLSCRRLNQGTGNWAGPGQVRTQVANYCYLTAGTAVYPLFGGFGGTPNNVVTDCTFSGVLIGLP